MTKQVKGARTKRFFLHGMSDHPPPHAYGPAALFGGTGLYRPDTRHSRAGGTSLLGEAPGQPRRAAGGRPAGSGRLWEPAQGQGRAGQARTFPFRRLPVSRHGGGRRCLCRHRAEAAGEEGRGRPGRSFRRGRGAR